MCHQREGEPLPKFKKAILVAQNGEVISGPVKVVNPRKVDSGWEAKVYGSDKHLPKGAVASWVKFKSLYTKYGVKINLG